MYDTCGNLQRKVMRKGEANMVSIPERELTRFRNLISGNAKRFGLTPADYIRKVWYHENASQLGEYIALIMMDELLPLLPIDSVNAEGKQQTS